MSIDLDFWKYEDGVSLDPAEVYQRACCGGEAVSGLAALPADAILREAAAAFPDWHAPDAIIHRGTAMTKAVSTIQSGRARASRLCQSKTARLDHTQPENLLQKSLTRVVRDFLAKTCHANC